MFIRIKGGYVNISRIAEITYSRKDGLTHIAHDLEGRVLGELQGTADVVVQLIPANYWNLCYVLGGDETHKDEIVFEPLAAFGLTAFGSIVPVNVDMEPMISLDYNGFPYGLKFASFPTIHCPQDCKYDDEKAYLEAYRAYKQKKK